MELVTAARRWFLSQDPARGYVSGRVFKHRLEEKVDGTGKAAIVLKRAGGWATPDPVTSQEYPILLVEYWVDPSRLPTGEIRVYDAEDRAWAMHRAMDPLIHGQRDLRWGAFGSDPGLKIVTIARSVEPDLTAQPDQHVGAPPIGDSVFLTVRYNLQVVH